MRALFIFAVVAVSISVIVSIKYLQPCAACIEHTSDSRTFNP